MSPSSVGHPNPCGEEAKAWRGPGDAYWRHMEFLGPQLSLLALVSFSLMQESLDCLSRLLWDLRL